MRRFLRSNVFHHIVGRGSDLDFPGVGRSAAEAIRVRPAKAYPLRTGEVHIVISQASGLPDGSVRHYSIHEPFGHGNRFLSYAGLVGRKGA